MYGSYHQEALKKLEFQLIPEKTIIKNGVARFENESWIEYKEKLSHKKATWFLNSNIYNAVYYGVSATEIAKLPILDQEKTFHELEKKFYAHATKNSDRFSS